MTSEQEIERIKRDWKEQWPKLETFPSIQKALADKNPVRLGELVPMLVHGNFWDKETAHRFSHPVVAFIGHEEKRFDTVETARKYVAYHLSLNPSAKVGPIFKETWDGTGIKTEIISI